MNVAGGISWPIGGLKAATEIMLPANSTDNPSQAVVLDYKGMKILYRGAQFTLLQSEYPDCYAQIGNGFGVTVFVTRTITGQTTVRSLDSNVSTLVAVGSGGKISRAADGGVTWAAVTSPVATDLKVIKYVPALS